MRTCKPHTVFDEDPRLISTLVVCTSWLPVPHVIQHLKERRLQTNPSHILLSILNWWWMRFIPSWLLSAATLLRVSNIFQVTTSGWLLNLLWSCILRENAMHQSLLDTSCFTTTSWFDCHFDVEMSSSKSFPSVDCSIQIFQNIPSLSAKIPEYFVRE
jgi:hypothetical protein